MESLKPPKQLLADTLSRLTLKGEPVEVNEACTQDSMNTLFKSVQEIEPSLTISDTQQIHLKKLPKLVEFMDHCCIKRRYFFCIKKCGKADCPLCKPPRENLMWKHEVFSQLHCFPDPVKKHTSASASFEAFMMSVARILVRRIDHL